MVGQVARWTAVGCAAVTCSMAVAAFLLVRDVQQAPGIRYALLTPEDVIVPLVYAVTGAALVWLRPRNAVGWILLWIGVCAMSGAFLGVYGVRAYVIPDSGLPAGQFALSLASWLWMPALFLLPTLLPLLYPTGQLPSPRWRFAVISTAVGLLALAPVAAFTVDSQNDWHDDARPFMVLPAGVEIALAVIGFALLAVTSVACIGNAARRTWRAVPPERAQLTWLLTTTTSAAVLVFTAPVQWMLSFALIAVPVAVAVGVLRYGLLGIQVVLYPTLLYGLLTLMVAVVFAGLTAVLSAVLPSGPLPTFVAAAVVAMGLVPAHVRLRRFVGRLLDGPASDPLAAVSRVGQVVSGAGDGPIPHVLASVADAIGSPHAVLRGTNGELIAQHPATAEVSPNATITVPLSYGGHQLGSLEVAPPPRGLTDTGRALLFALAPQVAVISHAAALNIQLDVARRHLIDAAQDERARLRRDLHDGLGPSLSGVALGLESVSGALFDNQDRARQILNRAQAEVRAAVEEVRRILDDLRPAPLDALGLVGALRAHAKDSPDGLAVNVTADAVLAPLDPEVEAAAYRITLEALTNVHRHAAADNCTVIVSTDDQQVLIEVHDDGHGLPAGVSQGLGLMSMRHRAESLGGDLDVHSGTDGTTVNARLPRQPA